MSKGKQSDEKITTAQAAEILVCDESHVRRLCRLGGLRGEKWGRDWQVFASSVAEFAENRPPHGRKPGKRNGSERSVRP